MEINELLVDQSKKRVIEYHMVNDKDVNKVMNYVHDQSSKGIFEMIIECKKYNEKKKNLIMTLLKMLGYRCYYPSYTDDDTYFYLTMIPK